MMWSSALLTAGTSDNVVGDYFNLGGMQPVTLEALVQKLLSCHRNRFLPARSVP